MAWITHPRDDEHDFQPRVLLHIPIGFLMGLASIVPFLGYGLVVMFLKYQRNEDAHTEDEAWKDIYGAMVGYVMAVLLVLGALVFFLKEVIYGTG